MWSCRLEKDGLELLIIPLDKPTIVSLFTDPNRVMADHNNELCIIKSAK